MGKNRSFEVEKIIVSDYATSDQVGQPIYVGVHHGDLAFAAEPPSWPPLFMSAVIIPKAKEFSLQVSILRPDGVPWQKFDVHYQADRVPRPEHKLNLNWQTPPGKFTGLGIYRVSISEGDQPIFNMPLNVFVSNEPPLEVEIKVTMLIPSGEVKIRAG